MYHIFPNALRHPQKVAESYPLATGGENLASTLRDMAQKKSSFLPELKEALSVAVPGVRDIRVVRAGSYYVVELKHERDDGTDKGLWFDLSHESDGTIRLLAMLTALFQDPCPVADWAGRARVGYSPRRYGRVGRHYEGSVAARAGVGCHPQPGLDQSIAHR